MNRPPSTMRRVWRVLKVAALGYLLGMAVAPEPDYLAAARHIYEKAVALGTGVWVSLGGLRDD